MSVPPKFPVISTLLSNHLCVTDPTVFPIPGLLYIENFLSPQEEQKLFNTIYSHPFSTAIHRRQQFYGEMYYHTTSDRAILQPTTEQSVIQSFDFEEMRWLVEKLCANVPLSSVPNQVLVNEYIGPAGIAHHVDDSKAFGDYVATVSLGDSIWMTFRKPRDIQNRLADIISETSAFLARGSLTLMQGDSRYLWTHGIPQKKYVPLPDGGYAYRNNNYVRVSLTLRTVLDGRKRAEKDYITWMN